MFKLISGGFLYIVKKNRIISCIVTVLITASLLFSTVYAEDLDGQTSPDVNVESAVVSTSSEAAPEQKQSSSEAQTTSSAAEPKKKDTSSLESKLSELKKESSNIKKQLNGLSDEKKTEKENLNKILAQIENLEQQILIVETQITDLDIEIKDLEDQIDEKELLIDEKKKDIKDKEKIYDENYELFKQRVRTMYMTSDASTLGMLLGAENMADFLEKSEFFGRVAKSDQDSINNLIDIKNQLEKDKNEIENQKKLIESNKGTIETKKIETESKRVELSSTKTELDSLKKEAEGNIITISNQEQNVRMNYNKTQEEIAATDAEIKRIIAANASDAGSEYVGGQFMWPVPGFYKVSCAYMGYPGHSGMDITGTYSGQISGAEIKAAGNGTVIAVVKGYTGYGHYVIVDHGGGYTTLYAHASSLVVSKGDQVVAGVTTLGYVGSTGDSTGPHLHFEVRINGAHQNPAGFLKG